MEQLHIQPPQGNVYRVDDGRRRGDCAALADALDAELGVWSERLHMVEPRRRHLRGAWQKVVGECRGQRLSRLIERHLFVERGTDSLCKAAVDLTVHDHWIDQLAPVFNDHIVENLDIADFGIDRNQSGVSGVAECAGVSYRLVSDGSLETARIDVVRKILRLQVPGAGDI